MSGFRLEGSQVWGSRGGRRPRKKREEPNAQHSSSRKRWATTQSMWGIREGGNAVPLRACDISEMRA